MKVSIKPLIPSSHSDEREKKSNFFYIFPPSNKLPEQLYGPSCGGKRLKALKKKKKKKALK